MESYTVRKKITLRREVYTFALFVIICMIKTSLVPGCVSPFTGGSIDFKAISDGAGGVIVSWWDPDSQDIHVQHIDDKGDTLWGEGGIITSQGAASYYMMNSDGCGGTIITWKNAPTVKYPALEVYDPIPVYSQRINSEGKILWGSGIPAGVDGVNVDFPTILPDGNGGMVVGWHDFTPVYNKGYVKDDVFRLQKISPIGQPLWGEKGISGIPWAQIVFNDRERDVLLVFWYETKHLPDQFWKDPKYSTAKSPTYPLYAQGVDSQGNLIWPSPKLINESFTDYKCISGTVLGEGKVLLSLCNSTSSESDTIFLCLDLNANHLWRQTVSNENGSPVPQATDGLGGLIITRTVSTFRGPNAPFDEYIYMQRINQVSANSWDERQPMLHSSKDTPIWYNMISDGAGGAWLVWCIKEKNNAYGNIFTQRLGTDGRIQWIVDKNFGVPNRTNGLPVLSNHNLKHLLPQIVNADSGGVIVVATVVQTSGGEVIYAQKLDSQGNSLWGDGLRVDW